MNSTYFYPSISTYSDTITFGVGVKIGMYMADLLEAIKMAEDLDELPDRDTINFVMRESIILVRMNKTIMGIVNRVPAEVLFDDPVYWANIYRNMLAGTHSVTQDQAAQWISDLADHAAKMQDSELFVIIDSIPEPIRNIGKTHVVVPKPDFMTEDMVDASRALLLYSDSLDNMDIEQIRKHISRDPWVRENLPDWFITGSGHLTKAGRAELAYHLTIQGAVNPPKVKNVVNYVPVKKSNERPGFELLLHCSDGRMDLSISRIYETIWNPVHDGDLFELQINRYQLPEAWRPMFKKQAICITGKIDKSSNHIQLKEYRVCLSLKESSTVTVSATLDPVAMIRKG